MRVGGGGGGDRLQAQGSPQLRHAQRGCLPHPSLKPPAAAHIHTECRAAGCRGGTVAAALTAAATRSSRGSSCMPVGRRKQLPHTRGGDSCACQAYRVQAGALRQRRS